MNSSSAYLLVSHGSRDPRHQAEVRRLAQLVLEQLKASTTQVSVNAIAQGPQANLPSDLQALSSNFSSTQSVQQTAMCVKPLVGTAALELHPLPLHQQIQQFCDRALSIGYTHVQIIPLFLLQGVHVMEDIPGEVAIAHQMLSAVTLHLCSHLGSHPGLVNLLLESLVRSRPAGILVSHGSRRPGGNQPVEAIAAQLGVVPAYWSVSPSLESQITALVQKGCSEITVLPYFLFPGGIIDAVAEAIAHYAQQFPHVRFDLTEPLKASAELADLVIDLIL